MKLFITLVAIILAVSAESEENRWQHFKTSFNRTYKSKIEEQFRFRVFKDNLRLIDAHNEKYDKGEESYFLAANQFADLTNQEFIKQYLSTPMPQKTGHREYFERVKNVSAVPDSFDWRDKNAVLEVKDQGQCGSCWAFSTTGALEGQNAIKHSKKVTLSEQELVDCSKSQGNLGCNGGLMDYGFEYVKANGGISTETSYPYTGKDGTCHSGTKSGVKVTSYKDVQTSQDALKEAVGTIGPISVAINADLIQLYGGGIFSNILCLGLSLDHGVLAVGYGTESKDYWIVKNSWGASWGEKGYFRLIRNKSYDCGIHKSASYPIIA